ncbi:MAG: MG2 domain-containing protein [bacterium]
MKTTLVCALVCATALAAGAVNMPAPNEVGTRQRAQKLHSDGNFKDALDLFRQLALDTNTTPDEVGSDMQMAASCLLALNRDNESDELRETFAGIHSNNWQALHAAGRNLYSAQHYGTMIAGKFERGPHRGGGRQMNSYERDRCRALQLMDKAMALGEAAAAQDSSPRMRSNLAAFMFEYARMLAGHGLGYGNVDSWRLQYLTDLSKLPDYEEGYWRGGYGDPASPWGAPVDAAGNPVFHKVPASWASATTDGERWRLLLVMTMELDQSLTTAVLTDYADFLRQQFDVQTMADYGTFLRDTDPDDATTENASMYQLHTLDEDETIARLATGIKRFRLPEDVNFLTIYRKVEAWDRLGEIFENRRQYDKAAESWKKAGRSDRVDQILGNWGQFEPVVTHPAGCEASVEFRFRNGNKVSFTAQEINIRKLLDDVKSYLKSNPKELDWQKLDVKNIGYRLVEGNQSRYVEKKVAEWDLDLKPRPMHFDRRITVPTPLKKAGAYLLTAKMADGNTSKIVMWLDDTVIVRKPLDKKVHFFVADAITGEPLQKINVEFFGYKQEYQSTGRNYTITTADFAEFTDSDGQVLPSQADLVRDFEWLIMATTPPEQGGRLAYLGFTGVWYGNYHDQEYNQTKVFGITDRPVYRPGQPVRFKFWVRHTKYDQADTSDFAGRPFTLRIHDSKGEKVLERNFTADDYGGFDGEFALPADAALGVYSTVLPGTGQGISFRVEEYKKPEFEVSVEAPADPVMLGEKITVTATARYYFGAPVTKGKVKYKVLRSDHAANWYPAGIWDWFYGPGYWWFACDYTWYPGWRDWGCSRPSPWWWPVSHEPPEVVSEAEVPVSPDGKLRIEIDTAVAKELHGDTDHRYEITVEVTDESRRTITGQGTVLVARKPFKVYAWVDRGHYRVGDVVRAGFSALTVDNKPVKGKGELVLYTLTYKDGTPVETAVEQVGLDSDEEGNADAQIKAAKPGQYRLAYKVTDAAGHTIEGGYVFSVMGTTADGTGAKDFRFNEIELVPDKREYKPGEKVRLLINTARTGATVVLFVRPANGVYLQPKILRLHGKSAIEEIEVTAKDMPNFFVEAYTISNGKLFSETREIVVPPEQRVLDLKVVPSATTCKPGEQMKVQVRLSDLDGNPYAGSTVMSVYDKAVEYISGGSNVQEIRAFFWKWRRHHQSSSECSLDRYFHNLVPPNAVQMGALGIFGMQIADEEGEGGEDSSGFGIGSVREKKSGRGDFLAGARADQTVMALRPAPMAEMSSEMPLAGAAAAESAAEPPGQAVVQPAIRTEFADTAYWNAVLNTDSNGMAEVRFKMPENLTGWKIRTWAMGHGTKVGEASAEVVTAKKLMLRLQAPRFFVEKDEVILSANIHNYLDRSKRVRAVLELDGKCLELATDGGPAFAATNVVEIPAGGEQRVDWRVKAVREGEAVVRMKALTDEESDAMQMRFPVYVHGMLKTESFSGVVRPKAGKASITINVPRERRIDESRLEIRFSPTLAGAMVDALPYLAEYPYGCTEQTLNTFLPSAITQKILKDSGIDLKSIARKRTNLNAQEIGDDAERARQWQRWDHNPVFDEAELDDMVRQGVNRLTTMQLSDGGWGWFSGWGENSWPHTTAYVVHGLQIAQKNGVALVPGVLDRGVAWLQNYQAGELVKLRNGRMKNPPHPWKSAADALDAFVYMVLADAQKDNTEMREFLYADRNSLPVYAKCMFGMALHAVADMEKRDMILRNIEQFLVEDKENQTAYLNLGNEGCWWYWYGSEYEALAYYLKLLAIVDPKSERAAGLVKYLLNNRKHATYWNSTRDTAICIEAMADYLRASGEDKPDMTVEIRIDGKKRKEVTISADNMFAFDNRLILSGDAIESGKHTIELSRSGTGPLYFNAYLSNFTLEDCITRAGLEIRVDRKYYKLEKVDATGKVPGARGQALDQKVEKYERRELKMLDTLKSGDLVEIELEIESKNDYEYVIFEDMKAAGFEPVEVRSGYNGNDLGAYMEFRDERVCLFVRSLARGRHSIAYRVRAEIPGRFSALPTRARAMYAPELRANSDEIQLKIED